MAGIERVDFSDPRAVELRAAMARELDERYADYPEDYGASQRARPEEFEGDRGVYLLALDDQVPVGIGGARMPGPGTAEIKNLYVVPEARGRSIAGMLMEGLESWARDTGCGRVILETGERQPEALALYARLGYERIAAYPPWNDDLSVCLAKEL